MDQKAIPMLYSTCCKDFSTLALLNLYNKNSANVVVSNSVCKQKKKIVGKGVVGGLLVTVCLLSLLYRLTCYQWPQKGLH